MIVSSFVSSTTEVFFLTGVIAGVLLTSVLFTGLIAGALFTGVIAGGLFTDVLASRLRLRSCFLVNIDFRSLSFCFQHSLH